MFLFPYHLRLAARSLRRDPAMSALMLLALGMGAGVWSIAVTQYTRFYAVHIPLTPTLHQVEILRAGGPETAFSDGARSDVGLASIALVLRTRISYPEYRQLAGSGIPSRENVGIRGQVLVRPPGGGLSVRIARFTDASFFSMFDRRFAAGSGWSPDDDAGGGGVVVLGAGCAETLFPGGSAVGQMVQIDDHPFRVAGVLAEQPPLNAPWQLLVGGGQQDALFLPLGQLDRLSVRPEAPFYRTPVGASRAELMASDALFVSYWVDLPTEEQRARYLRHVEARLDPGRFRLRSLAEWQRDFPIPANQISFFGFLGAVVLLAGGFNLARWLLTKGLARSGELGIYRALGAPRSSLFWRVLAEAAALPLIAFFNHQVRVVDVPLALTDVALAFTVVPTFLVGIAGAIYPATRIARTPPTLYLERR
jgi:putative ABC transport system permease protein